MLPLLQRRLCQVLLEHTCSPCRPRARGQYRSNDQCAAGVLEMYVPFQDSTFLLAKFDSGTYTHGNISLPRVDAIAAKGKDGSCGWKLQTLTPLRASRS